MESEPIERSAREVRARLADVIGDAIAGKITYITSNGRRVAAVVPLTRAEAIDRTGKAAGDE
jgi:prevent-host-death family protein